MNRIRWNEVCIGCGQQLVDNEIYDDVCANCKSGSLAGIRITPSKIQALTEEERKMLNIPSIDEFIKKMSDEMEFNYFKANKDHFVKLVEDLKAENKELKAKLNKKSNQKAVKKTVYITTDLNDRAEELGINFSLVLREGLKEEIKRLEDE